MPDAISFPCKTCRNTIEAAISEVGQSKSCNKCGEANTVPFPKVKVGGTTRKPRSSAESDSEKRHEKITGDRDKPEPDRGKPEKPAGNALFYILVPAVFMILGWGAVSSGFVNVDKISNLQPSKELPGNNLLPDTDPITTFNDQIAENLIMSARATRMARDTIETDYKVSLAEMEARGMKKEAEIIRQAIVRKEEAIKKERNQVTTILGQLAGQLPNNAPTLQNTIKTYMAQPSFQLDPDEVGMLQKIISAISGSPIDNEEFVRKSITAWEQISDTSSTTRHQ